MGPKVVTSIHRNVHICTKVFICRERVHSWCNDFIDYYAVIKIINCNYEDKKIEILVISDQGMTQYCGYNMSRDLQSMYNNENSACVLSHSVVSDSEIPWTVAH